jgi:hypothetical protein
MKTGPLDYVLCGLCITLTLGVAVCTTWVLSVISPLHSSPYQVLVDVGVFLFAYGGGTALLLAVLREHLIPFRDDLV